MSRTNTIVLVSAIVLLLFVLELVRRRRLQAEYSWLWLLTALVYFAVGIWPNLSNWVGQSIGATNIALALSFLGLYFLIMISIQFSIHLSRLATRNKDLAQQIAILDSELRKLGEALASESNPDQSTVILRLVNQNKNLAQQIAIFDSKLEKLTRAYRDDGSMGQVPEKQRNAHYADD